MPFPLALTVLNNFGGNSSGGGLGGLGGGLGGLFGASGGNPLEQGMSILSQFTGSSLGKDRYLLPLAKLGYNTNDPALQAWLFGKRGNNMSRAGALVADIQLGNKQILAEAKQWFIGKPAGQATDLTSKFGGGSSSEKGGAKSAGMGTILINIGIALIAWKILK